MAAKQWSSPPAMQIDTTKNYRITMETNKGTIEIELYPQHAPTTVNNFVFLAQEGFYDGVVFHRVIKSPPFVIQGGDPPAPVPAGRVIASRMSCTVIRSSTRRAC